VTELLISLLIWAMVFYNIRRGYRQQRRVDRYAVLTWVIFVSIGLTLTTRSSFLIHLLGTPVNYWLKSTATLTAAASYGYCLPIFIRLSPEIYRLRRYHYWLLALAPGFAGAMATILELNLAGELAYQPAHYLIKLLLEAYLLTLLTLWFIPINWQVFQREQVVPMRVKQVALLVMCATYALNAVLSVIFIPPILITGHVNPGPELVPRPAIGVLCLLVILVPHRWILSAGLPVRLYHYRRVAALERKLATLVPMSQESLQWRLVLRPAYLDLATYVTVINILDNYLYLLDREPPEWELYEQIRSLVQPHSEYADLVKAMERIA